MANLVAPNGATPIPNSPVPLDTIPVSPVNGTNGSNGATNEESSISKHASNPDELITVFHDPENFNVKHPLMNLWTLWFTKPPSTKVCHNICYRCDHN